MPVTFRILPRRGVVYVRYEGLARLQDGMDAFRRYMAHPDCAPGQKHLVDLSPVTALEQDYARLMELQALKAEQFRPGDPTTLIAYIAPHAEAQKLAALASRSWAGFPQVVARTLAHEAEALALLGLAESSVSELLALS